ncbi:hypothetical protein F4775DRAFT_591656 [Biscogniauxia sp. FL1348]|nr:hypothetical protein F4775DRAFT_591656 [Biscogniauxia sp. FL1348]
MQLLAIFAVFAIWASAFPLSSDLPAPTLGLQPHNAGLKPSNASIPAVSKPDGDGGETDDDHPTPDPVLEQHIAWYNNAFPQNQIPQRLMASARSGGDQNADPIQFHQYELWNTMRIAAIHWRNWLGTPRDSRDPRPGFRGVHFPREIPERVQSYGRIRVHLGELDWNRDTIYEFPMMEAGMVFGEHYPMTRIEHFIMFSFRNGDLTTPVWAGLTTRAGEERSNRHFAPAVAYDGTQTNQRAANGIMLAGVDLALTYFVPALFLRSWNPLRPFDKHNRGGGAGGAGGGAGGVWRELLVDEEMVPTQIVTAF